MANEQKQLNIRKLSIAPITTKANIIKFLYSIINKELAPSILCDKATNIIETIPIVKHIVVELASPSNPSVRLTALELDTSTSKIIKP